MDVGDKTELQVFEHGLGIDFRVNGAGRAQRSHR